jgi:hypothetical protein
MHDPFGGERILRGESGRDIFTPKLAPSRQITTKQRFISILALEIEHNERTCSEVLSAGIIGPIHMLISLLLFLETKIVQLDVIQSICVLGLLVRLTEYPFNTELLSFSAIRRQKNLSNLQEKLPLENGSLTVCDMRQKSPSRPALSTTFC